MTLRAENFPALFQFFGCCFHQDYLLEYSDWEEAVYQFFEGHARQCTEDALRELEVVLRVDDDRSAIGRLIAARECNYNPNSDGMSTIDWLKLLREKMREFLGSD